MEKCASSSEMDREDNPVLSQSQPNTDSSTVLPDTAEEGRSDELTSADNFLSFLGEGEEPRANLKGQGESGEAMEVQIQETDEDYGDSIQFFHHKLLLQQHLALGPINSYGSPNGHHHVNNCVDAFLEECSDNGIGSSFSENPFVFPDNVMEYGEPQFFPGNCVGYLETILEETDEEFEEEEGCSGRHWWTADSDTDTDSVIRVENGHNRLCHNNNNPAGTASNLKSISSNVEDLSTVQSTFRSSASSRPFELEDLHLLDQLDLAFEETLMEPRRRSGFAAFGNQLHLLDQPLEKQGRFSFEDEGRKLQRSASHDGERTVFSEDLIPPQKAKQDEKKERENENQGKSGESRELGNAESKETFGSSLSPSSSDSEPPEVAEEDFFYSSPGSDDSEGSSSEDSEKASEGRVLAEFSLAQSGSNGGTGVSSSSFMFGGGGGGRNRRSLEAPLMGSKLKSFRSFDSLNSLSGTELLFSKADTFPSFHYIKEDVEPNSSSESPSSSPRCNHASISSSTNEENDRDGNGGAEEESQSLPSHHFPPTFNKITKKYSSSTSTASSSCNSASGMVSSENLSEDSGIGPEGIAGHVPAGTISGNNGNKPETDKDSYVLGKPEFALNPLVFSSLSDGGSSSSPSMNSVPSLSSSERDQGEGEIIGSKLNQDESGQTSGISGAGESGGESGESGAISNNSLSNPHSGKVDERESGEIESPQSSNHKAELETTSSSIPFEGKLPTSPNDPAQDNEEDYPGKEEEECQNGVAENAEFAEGCALSHTPPPEEEEESNAEFDVPFDLNPVISAILSGFIESLSQQENEQDQEERRMESHFSTSNYNDTSWAQSHEEGNPRVVGVKVGLHQEGVAKVSSGVGGSPQSNDNEPERGSGIKSRPPYLRQRSSSESDFESAESAIELDSIALAYSIVNSSSGESRAEATLGRGEDTQKMGHKVVAGNRNNSIESTTHWNSDAAKITSTNTSLHHSDHHQCHPVHSSAEVGVKSERGAASSPRVESNGPQESSRSVHARRLPGTVDAGHITSSNSNSSSSGNDRVVTTPSSSSELGVAGLKESSSTSSNQGERRKEAILGQSNFGFFGRPSASHSEPELNNPSLALSSLPIGVESDSSEIPPTYYGFPSSTSSNSFRGASIPTKEEEGEGEEGDSNGGLTLHLQDIKASLIHSDQCSVPLGVYSATVLALAPSVPYFLPTNEHGLTDPVSSIMQVQEPNGGSGDGVPVKMRTYGSRGNEVEVVLVSRASRTPSPSPAGFPSSSSLKQSIPSTSSSEEPGEHPGKVPKTRVHFSPVVSEISWRESYIDQGSEGSQDSQEGFAGREGHIGSSGGGDMSDSAVRPLTVEMGEREASPGKGPILVEKVEMRSSFLQGEDGDLDDEELERKLLKGNTEVIMDEVQFGAGREEKKSESPVLGLYEDVNVSIEPLGGTTTLSMVPDLLSQCEQVSNGETRIDVSIEELEKSEGHNNGHKPWLRQKGRSKSQSPTPQSRISHPGEIPPPPPEEREGAESFNYPERQILPKIFAEEGSNGKLRSDGKSHSSSSLNKKKASKGFSFSGGNKRSAENLTNGTEGDSSSNKEDGAKENRKGKPGFFERLSKIRLSGSKPKKQKVHPKDKMDELERQAQPLKQQNNGTGNGSLNGGSNKPILKKSNIPNPVIPTYTPSEYVNEPEPEEASSAAFDSILEEIAGIKSIKMRMDKSSSESATPEKSHSLPPPPKEMRSFAKRKQFYTTPTIDSSSPSPPISPQGRSVSSDLDKKLSQFKKEAEANRVVISKSHPDLELIEDMVRQQSTSSPELKEPASSVSPAKSQSQGPKEKSKSPKKSPEKNEREWYKLLKSAAEKYYYRKDKDAETGGKGGKKSSLPPTVTGRSSGVVETDLDTGASREMLDAELVELDKKLPLYHPASNEIPGLASSPGTSAKARSLTNLSSRLPLSIAPCQFGDDVDHLGQGDRSLNEFDERAKSYEFLLDDNQKSSSVPPENQLRAETRQLSEHELRIQRSLQRLNVPEWYKKHEQTMSGTSTPDRPASGTGDKGGTLKLLSRRSEYGSAGGLAGGWAGLSAYKAPSMSSLQGSTGGRYSGSLNRSNFVRGRPATMSATRLSRESLSGSASHSPSAYDRCSFTYGMPFSMTRFGQGRMSTNSGTATPTSTVDSGTSHATSSYVKKPYLGWRSQERLASLGSDGAPKLSVYLPPEERLAADLLRSRVPIKPPLSDRPPLPKPPPRSEKTTLSSFKSQENGQGYNSIPPPSVGKAPDVHDSIREVTKAINQFVTKGESSQPPKPQPRRKSPGRKAIWIESSFVGRKPATK